MSQFFGILVGLLTGVLSGFGVGGGTLLILWLTLMQQMEQLKAGGVNLLYFISCALPALFGHIKNDLVEGQAVLFCILGGVPACVAGSLLASFLETGMLRRGFGVFLLIIGFRELFCKGRAQRSR